MGAPSEATENATLNMCEMTHLHSTVYGTVYMQGFYSAMLRIRGTSHGPVSVRLSVRPSQVGVLLKRLNAGSNKQHHTIAQGL